jgi:hypothetical protein
MVLRVMAKANPRTAPAQWIDALTKIIVDADVALLPVAIAAARELPTTALVNANLIDAVANVANSPAFPTELRVTALAIVAAQQHPLSNPQFDLLDSPGNAVTLRLAAADAFSRSHLTPVQLDRLCDTIQTAGPLELNRLLTPFEFSREEQVGLRLVSSLTKSPALPSLRMEHNCTCRRQNTKASVVASNVGLSNFPKRVSLGVEFMTVPRFGN